MSLDACLAAGEVASDRANIAANINAFHCGSEFTKVLKVGTGFGVGSIFNKN
jgi:hypothetical protein